MARVAATKVQVSRMVALANGKQFSNISLLDISFGISKKNESNYQNLQQFQRAGKGNLKGNIWQYVLFFSFERTFKTITLLPFFRLLLTSNRVTQYFYLDNHLSFFTQNLTLFGPSKYQDHSKPLKHLLINN